MIRVNRVGQMSHRCLECLLRLLAPAKLLQRVVPHLYDQYYWARRVQKLGVGVAGPTRERMTVAALACALRARRDEFDKRDIALVVVSGDMIEGTITPRLLEGMNRGATQFRRDEVGPLPTIDEFARAIADAATDVEPSRATIFVGSTN
jgi:hypothetical protein